MMHFKKYQVLESQAAVAEAVGKEWKQLQNKTTKKGDFFISAPLSSTPLLLYRWILDHTGSFNHWNKVRFILMDEQVEKDASKLKYIQRSDKASYERFARINLINELCRKTNTHLTKIFLKLKLNVLTQLD